MKKILFILLLISSICKAQNSQVVGTTVYAKDSLKVQARWLNSVDFNYWDAKVDTSYTLNDSTVHFIAGSKSWNITVKGTSVAAVDLSNYYTKSQSDARYLQSYTETDPVYLANGVPQTRTLTGGYGINTIGNLSLNRTISVDTSTLAAYLLRRKDSTVYYPYASNPKGYLTFYTETDPQFDTKFAAKTTDDLTQGSTNKYFSNTLARNAVSGTGSLSYNSSTGVFSYTQPTNVSTFTNDAGYLDNTTGDARYSLLAHTHTFSSLTSKPTTLSGYGITDAEAYDADLATIAGLTPTTDNFIVSVGNAWASRTPTQVKSTLAIANTDVSGLGTLATQNGTFSGTSSGTNTGDQDLSGYVPVARTVAGFALSSNVTLADLTATDATLIFSGTYNGSAARTIGLNLGNANTWTAKPTIQLTTEQLRLAYDASNYASFTTASNSQLTIGSNGVTPTILLGGFQSNTTPQTSSWAVIGSAAAGTTTQSQLLFAGATTVGYRRSARGSSNSTIGVGNSYAGTIFGQESVTEAASGTHASINSVVISPPSITDGAASTTNASALRIEAAPTGATNNYALNIVAGNTNLGGLAKYSSNFGSTYDARTLVDKNYADSSIALKAPLASPTFTGTVTIPTPFTLGATSVTSTGTQLNYLNAATGTTGTSSTNLVFSTNATLITPTLGVASSTSESIAGTGGNGFIELANQSSAPGTPTSASRIFVDASNRLSWKGTNGFVRTFDGTANTADRIYVLPDAAGTVALTSNKLSAFAATTSSELTGALSDESGTGNILTTNGSGASLTGITNANLSGSAGITNANLASPSAYTLQATSGNISAADAANTFFGAVSITFSASAGLNKIYIPATGTITKCVAFFYNNGVAGTTETSSIYIRLNNTTDYLVSSAVNNSTSTQVVSNTSMSVPVTGDFTDYVEMKWVAPTWATNPTNVRISVVMWIQR